MDDLKTEDIIKMLPVNKLLYSKTGKSNPVIERQAQKSRSDGGANQAFAPGSTLSIVSQTGVNFCDSLQSMLCFEITVAANDAQFAGSALDIIEGSQIKARSGKEISRVQYLNQLNYHRIRDEDPDMTRIMSNALFFGHTARKGAITQLANENRDSWASMDRATLTAGVAYKVMIPIRYLSGLFEAKSLLPPHLMRGLEVHLNLESYVRALVPTDPANLPTGYSMSNPYVLYDTYRMSDSVLKFLNENFASKKTGLVVEYRDYHGMTNRIGANTSWDYDVRRSASLALDIFSCITVEGRTEAEEKKHDSFASAPVTDTVESQWRVGAHYLPADKIRGVVEHYTEYLRYKNSLRTQDPVGVAYADFVGANTVPSAIARNYGISKFCAVLSRNAILDLSGIALSNSMTLALELNGLPVLGGALVYQGYAFLRHLRRAVCFLESMTLET